MNHFVGQQTLFSKKKKKTSENGRQQWYYTCNPIFIGPSKYSKPINKRGSTQLSERIEVIAESCLLLLSRGWSKTRQAQK